MTEEKNDILFDLLTRKAVYGLDDAEQRQLDEIDPGTAEAEYNSLEMTAASISMIGFSNDELLPAHLFSKIAADATKYVGSSNAKAALETPWPPSYKDAGDTDEKSAGSWFGWLGWAVAFAACAALVVNIWFIPFRGVEQAAITPPVDIPQILTPVQMREEMLKSTTGMIKADWTVPNPKDTHQVTGDVVWSDQKQAGYMRFRGLPVNDATKTTYQLWIFDKTQDKATPIDGGTFDVSSDGEVVIPFNAKLKAQGPEMFAVTVEKPGGVVVSKREKISVLAKVETPTA